MIEESKELRLSPGERLIVMMLSQMMEKLNLKTEFDTQFIQDALSGGHDWALKWQMPGVFPTEVDDPGAREETLNILGMWSHLQDVRDGLEQADLVKLKQAEAATTGETVFPGFDANNDPHYSVASFLIEKMGRFSRYKGRNLNSHSQSTLPMHRRMYERYQSILGGSGYNQLTVDQIIDVLKERVHPTRRP